VQLIVTSRRLDRWRRPFTSKALPCMSRTSFPAALLLAAVLTGLPPLRSARAAELEPLALADVARIAWENRAEIVAARARAEALAERPAIVGALEDPVISGSIDHYPFNMMENAEAVGRYDWNVSVEQRLPFSRVRSWRRTAARAEAARVRADAERIALDVVLEAQRAFFMVLERRRMALVLGHQHALAREIVSASAARYAAASGPQADVLRSEAELARVEAAQRALNAQTRAAEAMLNVAIGRPAGTSMGPLVEPAAAGAPAPDASLQAMAAQARPELRAGEAEVERASAEIEVMRTMYLPMGMIRVGRASTMADGNGAMVMLGVSVPLWRSRLRAGVAEARAMERMARADLDAMRLMIEGEISTARADVEATSATVQALASDVLPRARLAVDAALATYASGQGTLVSTVEAARALWEARSELVMAQTAAGEARARLDRALGRRLPAEGAP